MKTSLCANAQPNRSNFDFNPKSPLTPPFHRALHMAFCLLTQNQIDINSQSEEATKINCEQQENSIYSTCKSEKHFDFVLLGPI